MKAPQALISAAEKAIIIFAFLPVVAMVYPETAAAAYNNAVQRPNDKALVFSVNSKSKTEIVETQTSLKYDDLVQNQRNVLSDKVKEYLESKGSPLSIYANEIIQQPQWQRALAISYVESNFGKRCADNNCSGIGVHPKHPSWRKYATKLDWFKDMTMLLEKPIYKERYNTCAKMRGVYVVPGSDRWVDGCNKVSNDLLKITADAEAERFATIEAATVK